MISPQALSLIATLPAQTCQRACLLLASYDLTLPRKIWLGELDHRFGWPDKTTERLLGQLVTVGMMVDMSRPATRRPRSSQPATSRTIRMASEYLWTPKVVAEWWAGQVASSDRSAQVSKPNQL